MAVCDVPVLRTVCNEAGDAAGAVVTAPFDWLAQSSGGAAQWMFESLWQVIATTTFVDVTSGEYTKVYNIMFGIGIFVMVGFFMLQVIGGMIRREPAALSRAVLGLAKSILGSFVRNGKSPSKGALTRRFTPSGWVFASECFKRRCRG